MASNQYEMPSNCYDWENKSYIQSMNSEDMKFEENSYSIFHWTSKIYLMLCLAAKTGVFVKVTLSPLRLQQRQKWEKLDALLRVPET